MIQNGGGCGFKMIQIKKFPCENKREAEAEEDRTMQEPRAPMNDRRASRNQTVWCIDAIY